MDQNNRNRRSSSYQEDDSWNQDRDRNRREDDYGRRRGYEGNYGNEQYGQQYGQSGRENDYYQNRGYGSSYDNDDNYRDRNRRSYQSDSDYNQGNYGSQSRQRGYTGGSPESGRWAGEDYGSGTGSTYGNSSRQWRNQDYDDGFFGSAGYGNTWNQRNRDYDRNSDYGRGGNYGSYNRNRDRDQDRSWWDRTRDEVSSWFGDEDAERRRRRDQISRGEHRGKGPKDYQRSQERIREDVCDRLCDNPLVDASEIDVTVVGSEVTLKGKVDSKDSKRRAEDIAESVSGVSNVQNHLKVENTYASNSSFMSSSTPSSLPKTNSGTASGIARNEKIQS